MRAVLTILALGQWPACSAFLNHGGHGRFAPLTLSRRFAESRNRGNPDDMDSGGGRMSDMLARAQTAEDDSSAVSIENKI